MSYDWEKYYQEKEVSSRTPDEALVRELSGQFPGRLLEFGAGEGADAVWFAQGGWKVTAVDYSKTALQRLLSEARKQRLKITASCADVMKYVAPEPFDLVYMAYLHFSGSDRPALFKKCNNLLKTSGTIVYISIVSDQDPAKRTLPEGMYPSEEELKKEFIKAGFKIVRSLKEVRKVEFSPSDSFTGEILFLMGKRKF